MSALPCVTHLINEHICTSLQLLDEDGGLMVGVLVSSFVVLPGAGGLVFPVNATCKDLYGFPVVPVAATAGCNCASTSASNKLIVSLCESKQSACDVSTEESGGGAESEGQTVVDSLITVVDTVHTLSFVISGSTWEQRYQTALHDCKRNLTSKIPVVLDLCLEPDNPVDRNAIRIDFKGGVLGYVGKVNIPRIQQAIKEGKIVHCSLSCVHQTWAPDGKKVLRGNLIVSKRGTWCKECPNYEYNQLLNV